MMLTDIQSRRQFLSHAAALVSVTAVLPLLGQTGTKPNIIIILTDDQGFGDMKSHGATELNTPNLDALEKESVRFENFYADPVCAPSRASLLTGRDYLRTGVCQVANAREYMHPDERTLADTLGSNGYHTGHIGKWHLGASPGWMPWDRGFSEGVVSPLNYPHEKPWFLDQSGSITRPAGWAVDTMTDMAVSFIQRNRGNPFFLHLCYMSPHEPWAAPDEYISRYSSRGLSRELSTFFGMVEHLDTNIGRLCSALNTEGIAENTILLFVSDNGFAPGSLSAQDIVKRNARSLKGTKGMIWEGGVRVPCFLRWPSVLKPKTIDDPCHMTDIAPTVLSSAGITGGKFDGIDLLPFLRGASLPAERTFFSCSPLPKISPSDHGTFSELQAIPFEQQRIAVRTREYKYVYEAGTAYLFAIEKDEQERVNIAAAHPDLCKKFEASARAFFSGIQDSPHAFQHPVYILGTAGADFRTENPPDAAGWKPSWYIPLYSASRVEGNVKIKGGSSTGWNAPGDAQILPIDVRKTGTYELNLSASNARPGTVIRISINGATLESTMTDVNNKRGIPLGSLHIPSGRGELAIGLVSSSTSPAVEKMTAIVIRKK